VINLLLTGVIVVYRAWLFLSLTGSWGQAVGIAFSYGQLQLPVSRRVEEWHILSVQLYSSFW